MGLEGEFLFRLASLGFCCSRRLKKFEEPQRDRDAI